MSKSGSRYGRRSNWFKIHCLLQAQHQQQQQQQQQHHQVVAAAAAAAAATSSTATSSSSVSTSAAAATAFGMLSHGSPYPGLYQQRTKEELMMLGLEVYKHAEPSPSVSSPDSHNSENSGEGTLRSNTLLNASNRVVAAMAPQIRKELSPFLQLPFPNLSSMPVMPPPSFLPPSHMLFPSYHPALYQHQHQHQTLLRPIQPQQLQQELQNAVAMRRLISSSATELLAINAEDKDTKATSDASSKDDTLNNNHLPNGSKVAEELTKCFYLDAMIKSQQHQSQNLPLIIPPNTHRNGSGEPMVAYCKNGLADKAEQLLKQESNDNESSRHDAHKEKQEEDDDDEEEVKKEEKNEQHKARQTTCRDLIVSMTPPRSPTLKFCVNENVASNLLMAQDNPIDLSIKVCSSAVSCISSKCSLSSSVQATTDESDNEPELELEMEMKLEPKCKSQANKLHNNEDAATACKCVKLMDGQSIENKLEQFSNKSILSMPQELTVEKVLRKKCCPLDLTTKL